MAMMAPAMRALTTVATMVAMMLPSVAPAVWRYHRHLRALRVSRVARRATLFTIGYASVWSAIGLALFVADTELSPTRMASPANSPVAPWTAAAVIVCAGLIQRSRWKATQLLRCHARTTARAAGDAAMMALIDGGRLGAACVLSCAAPMAVLFVVGPMDARMMLLITAAITAERVAPNGARMARCTGAIALAAGLAMCLRAIDAPAVVAETQMPGTITSTWEEIMAKAIFGNHSSVIVPVNDRDRIRRFYCDVLGGQITKAEDDRDFIRLGGDFYIAFLYSDVPDVSEFLRTARAVWLEIKSDDVEELRRSILDFGARKLEMPDPHLYFQAPGGQCLRLVGIEEDLSFYEGTKPGSNVANMTEAVKKL